MDLSVVIVNYNTREELARCLDSVMASSGLDSFEVIVADNASTDGSAQMVERRFSEVRLIRTGANLGFARANNLCWREARSALVLFLNSDTIVPPDALRLLVSIAKSRPEIGVLGPRLRYENGAIQMSYGRSLGLWTELLEKCRAAGYRSGSGPLRKTIEKAYSRERLVDWVSGACLLTRRDLLETVSGFDENFFLYSEDVDLCARILELGASVLFTPEVEIVHLLGRSGSRNRLRIVFESQRSRLYFYRKHRGGLSVALLELYMGLKAGLGWLFRPGERAAHASVLRMLLHAPLSISELDTDVEIDPDHSSLS
jgi:GT2 family glycosyltransferase